MLQQNLLSGDFGLEIAEAFSHHVSVQGLRHILQTSRALAFGFSTRTSCTTNAAKRRHKSKHQGQSSKA